MNRGTQGGLWRLYCKLRLDTQENTAVGKIMSGSAPLIPAICRQRQVISDFEARLIYRVSSRAVRATQRNPVGGGKTDRQTDRLHS